MSYSRCYNELVSDDISSVGWLFPTDSVKNDFGFITGIIHSGGIPIEGINVIAYEKNNSNVRRTSGLSRGSVDKSGQFVLPMEYPGDYQLFIEPRRDDKRLSIYYSNYLPFDRKNYPEDITVEAGKVSRIVFDVKLPAFHSPVILKRGSLNSLNLTGHYLDPAKQNASVITLSGDTFAEVSNASGYTVDSSNVADSTNASCDITVSDIPQPEAYLRLGGSETPIFLFDKNATVLSGTVRIEGIDKMPAGVDYYLSNGQMVCSDGDNSFDTDVNRQGQYAMVLGNGDYDCFFQSDYWPETNHPVTVNGDTTLDVDLSITQVARGQKEIRTASNRLDLGEYAETVFRVVNENGEPLFDEAMGYFIRSAQPNGEIIKGIQAGNAVRSLLPPDKESVFEVYRGFRKRFAQKAVPSNISYQLTVSPFTDNIPPSTTSQFSNDKKVTLTCRDEGGSGCKEIWYRIGGGASELSWESYPGTSVSSLYKDASGDMWVSSERGAAKFDGSTWTDYGLAEGLKKLDVAGIVKDTEGNLWIDNDYAISRFDGAYWNHYSSFSTPGLIYSYTNKMLVTSTGDLWTASFYGVSRFDGSDWVSFTTSDGLASNYVYDIAEDNEGNLWFATSEGVSKYENGSWQTFTTADGLIYDWTYAVLYDSSGDLWFGTFRGVSRFDGTSWQNFDSGSTGGKIPDDTITDIAQDSKGNIWLATEGGISRYDGSSWKAYTQSEGLLYDDVNTILADDADRIWAGTNQGLTIFSPDRYDPGTRKYTGPVQLSDNEFITYYSTDLAGNVESVKTGIQDGIAAAITVLRILAGLPVSDSDIPPSVGKTEKRTLSEIIYFMQAESIGR